MTCAQARHNISILLKTNDQWQKEFIGRTKKNIWKFSPLSGLELFFIRQIFGQQKQAIQFC